MHDKQSTHSRWFSPAPSPQSPASARRAFTLTELLIVIAIIAVLAGLIAAAAVNAMRAANRGRITLEIKNISGALENFKNDFGAYPPNGMNPGPVNSPPPANTVGARVRSDFSRMFKKAFPRHQEPAALIDAIAGISPPSGSNVSGPLPDGLTAGEALYFWLGGFSSDEQFPLSGPGGPSFLTGPGTTPGEVLEDRNRRYEFDLGRLGPRNDGGAFNDSAGFGRFLTYEITVSGNLQERRINFWRYTPSGSEQPLAYFDVSRYKPEQYDLWAARPSATVPHVFAFKEGRSGVATPTGIADVVFVDQGKFQIVHPGLDDAWSTDFERMSLKPASGGWGKADSVDTLLLYPTGPFIGEIGDTLTSFTDGTLEDAVEE